jgi:hypothetical protein
LAQAKIFAAVFLNDGNSVFECQIELFELGKIISHEVFDFGGGEPFWRKERSQTPDDAWRILIAASTPPR